MRIEVVEEGPDQLAAYGSVPIAFEITETFAVDFVSSAEGVPTLTLRPATRRVVKNYDAIIGNAPVDWAARFDVSAWRFFVARIGDERVGGAIVIARAPGVDMLENRADLGLVWDIRVAPSVRHSGVGSALLRAVEKYARDVDLRELKVETQNINVPACRFYARHGFQLRRVDRVAYPAFPHEVQLLWYKDVAGQTSG